MIVCRILDKFLIFQIRWACTTLREHATDYWKLRICINKIKIRLQKLRKITLGLQGKRTRLQPRWGPLG